MITSPNTPSGQRDVLGVHGNTAAERAAAAAYIRDHANDQADEHLLLDLLGLTPAARKEKAA